MGRNDDFDDGEDRTEGRGSTYPTGPIPPHERIWRHPSELGFAALTAADSSPVNIGRTGRSLLGISTVACATMMAVLFVALQPTSPDYDTQNVIALTNSELSIASLNYPSTVALGVGTDLPDPNPRRSNDAVGIMLPNGQFLITTMAAIAEVDAIDVRLAGGRTVRARVVQTYPELSVAVLSVSEESTSSAFPEIDVMRLAPRGVKFSKGQVVMALIDVPRQLTVSDKINDVLYSLQSSSMTANDLTYVSEGTPIVNKSGQLVGLCTHFAGVLGFIPFTQIEVALANWISNAGAVERKKSR